MMDQRAGHGRGLARGGIFCELLDGFAVPAARRAGAFFIVSLWVLPSITTLVRKSAAIRYTCSERITKEFTMATRHSSEMGTDGALGQKLTAWSRPLLAGALAAGVIALGASSAVAASPVGSPVSHPSTAWSHSTSASMMIGTSMGIMLGTTAPMMTICTEMGTMPNARTTMMSRTHTTMTSLTRSGASTGMMTGTGTATPPATSTGTGTGMMSGTSTATPPATRTGTSTSTMNGTSTGAGMMG